METELITTLKKKLDAEAVNQLYILDRNQQGSSQNGEETFINHILSRIGDDAFLVEILGKGESPFSNFDYFYKNGYRGLLIEHDSPNPNAKNHWVIKENIVAILKTYKCPKSFDALSIDLNGNDFWVLDELLSRFKPKLIVAEFNSSKEGAVSIKYDSTFLWQEDDYYGFSFEAGKNLAEKHGYYIIFQNDELNLYMVDKEHLDMQNLPECTYQKRISFAHNPKGEWVEV